MSKSPTSNTAVIATVWLFDSRTVDDAWFREHADRLSDGEAERYSRFVRKERKRQFLIGRMLLRHAVGRLVDLPASLIKVIERPGHAPKLEGMESEPWFSISHSGPWIACATSAHSAIGLDIEVMDAGRDLIGIAEQTFDAKKANAIASLKEDARVGAFYEAWCQKEAAYKLQSICDGETNKHYLALPYPEVSIVVCSAFPIEKAFIQNVVAEEMNLHIGDDPSTKEHQRIKDEKAP